MKRGLSIGPRAGLALLVAACAAPEPASPPEQPRTPTAVAGKPVVATPTGPAIADELIVRFAAGVSDGRGAELAGAFGGELIWRGPRTGAAVVRFADRAAADAARRAMRALPEVAWVGRSQVAEGAGISTSPGPIDLQWNLPALRLDPDRGPDSAGGVRIAVLDTGAAYEDYTDGIASYALAPDLAGVSFVAPYDLVNLDDHANDDQGHGTHITGVIAASGGIAAISSGAEVVPVKVLDATNRGTELALAEGILHAVDSGADVINMSLSFSPGFFPSPVLQQAVDEAARRGVILVASVGNHGSDLVAYPAAFRDVIAVGASALTDAYHPSSGTAWASAHAKLAPTDYSNRGYAVDVVAPAGRIDRDRDGDGNPEAIIAQSFVGDPTAFDYILYAGTSQAAAQVSGIAAVMRARNSSLSPSSLRALLGETARRDGAELLTTSAGRGFARADLATGQAGLGRVDRPRARFSAATAVVLRQIGADRVAEATVEIADAAGAPAAGVTVYGTFTGNVVASATGVTGADGIVRFLSPPLGDDAVIAAFQVDAVASGATVDRPSGFVRIDSCSLGLLSDFAVASGINTSPGPITVRYDELPADAIATVTLLNYAWTGAVAPMAVAVDESWYRSEFAGSEALTVRAFGWGINTSPLVIDPARSFHPSVTQVWQPTVAGSCVDLVVRTAFVGATTGAVSPIIADPTGDCGGSCDQLDQLLLEMWQAWGAGIQTSPVWQPGSGVDQTVFDRLAAVMQRYVDFGGDAMSQAVGTLGDVLDAAGIGLMPIGGISSNAGVGQEVMR
jgi:serine protease